MAIKLTDPVALARSLARFAERTQKTAATALRDPAEVLLEEVRSQLSRPGSGRVYGRGPLGSKRHQASAPGEPPAPDTRALLNSARIEKDGETLRVVVSGPAAARLEFGSRDLSPRPFMRPALSHARGRMGAKLATTLKTKRAT